MNCFYCDKSHFQMYYNEIIERVFCEQCRDRALNDLLKVIDSHSGEAYERYQRVKEEYNADN